MNRNKAKSVSTLFDEQWSRLLLVSKLMGIDHERNVVDQQRATTIFSAGCSI